MSLGWAVRLEKWLCLASIMEAGLAGLAGTWGWGRVKEDPSILV